MMIKKLLGVAAGVCLALCMTVHAEGEVAYSVTDVERSEITVQGRIDGEITDTFVAVSVQKPGVSAENIPEKLSGEDWKQYFAYQAQTVLKDGAYSAVCELPPLEGQEPYLLSVSVNGALHQMPVYLYAPGKIDAFIAQLNSMDINQMTEEELALLAEQITAYFSCNSGEIYEKYVPQISGKARIAEVFMRHYDGAEIQKNDNAANPYSQIAEVFENAVLCCAYREGLSAQMIENGTFLYAGRLGFTEKKAIYDLAARSTSDSGKRRVADSITSRKPQSLRELKEFFAQEAIRGAMNDSVTYGSGHIGEILSEPEVKAVLTAAGWQEGEYLSSDKTAVQQKYHQNPAGSFWEMVELLNRLAKENKSGGANPRPGGGTGGASGGGAYQPIDVPGGEVSGAPDAGEPIQAGANTIFKDLEGVPWAEKSIMGLYAMGVINGVGGNRFDPDASVTREEFTKMLMGAMKLPINVSVSAFSDVPENAWYTPYVASGTACGIIYGISEEEFGTGRNITREQMAAMCARALEMLKKDLKGSPSADFADREDISAYALDSVNKMRGLRIINGDENGYFRPQASATRAEAAHILYLMATLS